MSIPKDIAEKIYYILVEHAGYYDSESNKGQFVYHQSVKPSKYNQFGGCTEYRFQGSLGMGGKFWNTNNKFYISSYTEDKGSKEAKIISNVNELLKPIYQEYLKRKK